MDVFYTYTYGSAAWLSLQAVPMIAMPNLIISLLSAEAHKATDLEVYFVRSQGFTLFTLALVVLFFTGTIPLSSSISQPVTLNEEDPKSPYAVPIVRTTTLFHTIAVIYCYVRSLDNGMTGFMIGAFGYAAMATIGVWCLLFGSSNGKISKRTGKDKRMAGFPFANVNRYDAVRDRQSS